MIFLRFALLAYCFLPIYRSNENENTNQVADSIKEKILRMPQGGGKIGGVIGKVAKMHMEAMPGQAGRTKAASDQRNGRFNSSEH